MYINIFKKSMIKTQSKGFTLIELLVVIGILAILLSITLIAINPARQFGSANNTKRKSAVLQILNAVGAYAAENKGNLPTQVTGLVALTPVPINATQMANLCPTLVPNYIPALPTDPQLNTPDIDATLCGGGWVTGYNISRDATNRVTVSAPSADNSEVISVSR